MTYSKSRSISWMLSTKEIVARKASSVSYYRIFVLFACNHPNIFPAWLPTEIGLYYFQIMLTQITSNFDIIPGVAGVNSAHSVVAFAKSKALLGSIGGINRARVQDLQNPDPDKALPPHWRVPQLETIFKHLHH